VSDQGGVDSAEKGGEETQRGETYLLKKAPEKKRGKYKKMWKRCIRGGWGESGKKLRGDLRQKGNQTSRGHHVPRKGKNKAS